MNEFYIHIGIAFVFAFLRLLEINTWAGHTLGRQELKDANRPS